MLDGTHQAPYRFTMLGAPGELGTAADELFQGGREMDLEKAIAKHAEWKLRFRAAIRNGETLDVGTIMADDCCDLGRWLHGDGKVTYGLHPTYSTCVGKHAEFHSEAAKIAKAINAKAYTEAERLMGADSRFKQVSSELVDLLYALMKERQGVPA